MIHWWTLFCVQGCQTVNPLSCAAVPFKLSGSSRFLRRRQNFDKRPTRHWQESWSREILEEKLFLVSPLKLEKWTFMSRSPLDFQDFEKTFLFLLSVHKIFVLNFSFSSRLSRFCWTNFSSANFQDFLEQFLFLLSIFKKK